MAQEIIGDAKFNALEVTCGTYFNLIRLRGVADGIEPTDAATYGQLSTIAATTDNLSSMFSTLAYYVAVDACLTVTNKQQISTLNYEVFSTLLPQLSTLEYYVAVDACLTVQNKQQISTLNYEVFSTLLPQLSTLEYYVAVDACLTVQNKLAISTNVQNPRQVQFSTFDTATYNAANIVGTVTSTLGWLNTFTNSSGVAANVNLGLESLGIWPQARTDAIRFSHVGALGDVSIYAESSANPGTLLGTLAPGDTKTFVYSKVTVAATDRSNANNYYTLKGF